MDSILISTNDKDEKIQKILSWLLDPILKSKDDRLNVLHIEENRLYSTDSKRLHILKNENNEKYFNIPLGIYDVKKIKKDFLFIALENSKQYYLNIDKVIDSAFNNLGSFITVDMDFSKDTKVYLSRALYKIYNTCPSPINIDFINSLLGFTWTFATDKESKSENPSSVVFQCDKDMMAIIMPMRN